MKIILLLAALAATADLPNFEFMNVAAGVTAPPEALKKCGQPLPGVRSCGGLLPVAGVKSAVLFWYYRGQLSSVFASAPNINYANWLSAFRAKYGEPCKTYVEPWRNRYGATMDNTVTQWCFRSGAFRLYQLGTRADWIKAEYTDDVNKVPDPPAKVDF